MKIAIFAVFAIFAPKSAMSGGGGVPAFFRRAAANRMIGGDDAGFSRLVICDRFAGRFAGHLLCACSGGVNVYLKGHGLPDFD